MFILALIAGVIIGYILKGNLQNLSNIKLKGVYLIVIGFFIEFMIIILVQNKILTIGKITYLLDILMYTLIFIFIIKNKGEAFIVLMGIGFLLNAIAIFFNNGAMPVSYKAIESLGFPSNVATEGLYSLISSDTYFGFLGDIIPINFIGRFIVSGGDIIAAIGMMFFIITKMRKR